MEENTIQATKSQIEDFKESLLWKDMQNELVNLFNDLHSEYDLVGEPKKDIQGNDIYPSTAETLIHLGDIKGRKKAIKYFLNIPDILIQSLEGNKDDTS